MTKKLIVVFVAAFLILTVVIAVLTGRQSNQTRPASPATQANKTLNLDTSPPQFPQR